MSHLSMVPRKEDTRWLALLSVSLHIGMVMLAHFTVGAPLLANAALVGVLCLVWMNTTRLPSMVERGGYSQLQTLTPFVASPALLTVGIAAAALIEHTSLAPTVRAALFLPWWWVYFTVMLMQHVNATQSKAGWRRPYFIAAALSVWVTGLTFLGLSVVGYWP